MGLSRAGWAAPKSESGHHRLHHKQPPSSQLFSPNDAATLPQRQRSQPLIFSPGPPPKLKSCHNMPGPSPILGIISTLSLYLKSHCHSQTKTLVFFSPASVNGAHPACILTTWPPPPPVIVASNMSVTHVTQYFRDPLTPAS